MDTRGTMTVIRAQVPMAEMLTYEQHLTSATGGRGSYHMEYDHYEEVPHALQAKIISATNPEGVWDLKNGQKIPMVGRMKIVQGIRPGVISFALGFGHWGIGASDCTIDDMLIPADARRAKGIHGNAAMRVDDYLKNTCMVDTVGGSVSFYDTHVKVVKVT